jgi:Ca-activated chloride channel family protein
MKWNFKAIAPYALIVILLGGVVFIYFEVVRKSQLAEIGSTKRQAKRDYMDGRFVDAAFLYKHLVDSLKIDEEPVHINYANAGFLSAAMDSITYSKQAQSRHNETDSASNPQAQTLGTSQQEYLKLTGAKNKTIGSMANNQLGVYVLKVGDGQSDETGKVVDSLIRQSLLLFKEALKKDPANDSARYNYELLKMKLNFPEMVYHKAEQLVQRRRYGQAWKLMEAASKKDIRLKKYEDFTKKTQAIYKIDSLKKI